MSSFLEHITANSKETKRLIGIDYQQLQQLIAEASTLSNQQEIIQEKAKVRIIQKEAEENQN